MNAIDRVVGGLEKKNKMTTEEERHSIALHEAGHATVSWFLKYANPLVKVTIVPRGKALGAAWYLPEERQITTTQASVIRCVLPSRSCAEEVFLGRYLHGCSQRPRAYDEDGLCHGRLLRDERQAPQCQLLRHAGRRLRHHQAL